MNHRGRLTILLVVATLVLVALAISPRLPQPSEYHRFADTRPVLGVANGLNVLSNVPFLLIGGWGMWFLTGKRGAFIEPIERLPYFILFLGVALTCFGSGYYHLAPDNVRLVWDRLPMTIGFTALFAAILGERVGLKAGLRTLPVFLMAGAASVGYWIWTEHAGRGDLRPYLFVQFFPLLAIPLMVVLFPGRYTRAWDMASVIGLYLVAKVLEMYDTAILAASGNRVSGHTLKHLAAAGAVWFVLRMLQKRQPA